MVNIPAMHRIIVLFLSLFSVSAAFAQESAMRINVQEDRVFVYHNKANLLGEGFNIYRANGAGDFEKLNEQPVVGILYPEELPVAL